MANQLTLKISGMHCDGCVRRVTGALEKLPGVNVEGVQVGTAQLRVADGGSNRAAIKAAIQKIGFDVELEEKS